MDQPIMPPQTTEQPVLEDPISKDSLKRLRLVVLVLALLAIAYRASSTIVSEGDSAALSLDWVILRVFWIHQSLLYFAMVGRGGRDNRS